MNTSRSYTEARIEGNQDFSNSRNFQAVILQAVMDELNLEDSRQFSTEPEVKSSPIVAIPRNWQIIRNNWTRDIDETTSSPLMYDFVRPDLDPVNDEPVIFADDSIDHIPKSGDVYLLNSVKGRRERGKLIPSIQTFKQGNKIYTEIGSSSFIQPLEPMGYKEHQRIMDPAATSDLEGIDAITKHLGEGIRPEKFKGHQTNGEGLTQLEKIIYNEAVLTGQGDACLPHEVHSKRAWFRYAGGVKARIKRVTTIQGKTVKDDITTEEAETLFQAFKILDTTPAMAKKFEQWLAVPDKFNNGFKYFQDLAIQMVLVTDEGEPTILSEADMMKEDVDDDEQEISADNPAEIVMLEAVGYHKLDDPQDAIDPELGRPVMWEDKQPKAFKSILARIRTSKDLAKLKAIGESLFNDKTFTKTQTTVIWDEYHRRKFHLSPKLRPLALKALERLTDPKVNTGKVAAWLHGNGKKRLTKHEQSVMWAAWKKIKGVKTAKSTKDNPPIEQIPLDYYDENHIEE